MWSVWLVFCDCDFVLSALWWISIRGLETFVEASWWNWLTVGETGSGPDGWAMLNKSLIQFSVDGWGCVPSLLFDLGPNYGGGNEDSGLLQKVPCKHCHTPWPQHCSRPPQTHTSAGDSWTLTDKSGSVSCGVSAPFSWVLVHTRFYLCPPRVCLRLGSPV